MELENTNSGLQFNNPFQKAQTPTIKREVDSVKASKSIEVAAAMARRFPRDPFQSFNRIMNTCTREKFAQEALYEFRRGGTKVEGPGIRFAEAIAQTWGNIHFGIKLLNKTDTKSEFEAYCWDLETNTQSSIEFDVKHIREKRTGDEILTSERDIYELGANYGSRRLRKCILTIIPADIVDEAINQCKKTLSGSVKDTKATMRTMIEKFKEFGVTTAMLEKRIGSSCDAATANQIVSLFKVYNSLKDDVGKVSDFFQTDAVPSPGNLASKSIASNEPAKKITIEKN